ncbi:MAG: hypothetical protein K2G28_12880, partial [Acetatifactor sp.]|nr:hypothetical protein [Acetatifactor sp.]
MRSTSFRVVSSQCEEAARSTSFRAVSSQCEEAFYLERSEGMQYISFDPAREYDLILLGRVAIDFNPVD